MRMPRYIDLSQTIEDGLVTYKGLPAPLVCDFLSHEASRPHYDGEAEFHIGKIEMVANTGTYLDAPFHRFRDGADLADLSLDALVELPGLVVHAPERRAISEAVFLGKAVRGCAVLVHTGWSKHWKTDAYFDGHPFLTEGAARYLRDGGAALVGIDSLNIDDTTDARRPVHTTLLGADILIVEHLTNLAVLPDSGFRFSAVPVRVRGLGSFPVRAFAALNPAETEG